MIVKFIRVRCSYIAIAFLILTLNCSDTSWERSYYEAAKRSLTPGVDLILVPEIFSNVDEEWLIQEKNTSFTKAQLESQLKQYGRSWNEFYRENQEKIHIDGEIVTLIAEGSTHATNYFYDKNIPLVFYGNKWIHPGLYQDRVFQQHIVPTVAKVLNSPLPNSAKLPPIQKILKDIDSEFSKPEIVVTVVIDQGGLGLYKSHPDSFPHIKRLMERGAYFPNAEVGHLDAHTGVGHVAIGTGAFPRDHKIIANDWLFRNPGNQKSRKRPLYQMPDGSITPDDMMSESFADVWDASRGNKPVIISQCYAVRASIGMAGHGAMYKRGTGISDRDFVYWIHKYRLDWMTNDDFYQLPKVAENYSLLPYHLANNPKPWWGESKVTVNDLVKNFYPTVATSTQAKLEGELFRSVLRSEIIEKGLHRDGETDLAYVTLKATDAVGHRHGYESEEARLVLEETDRQVGLIWDLLEEEWGDEYILILTADHGAAPLREISKGMYLRYASLLSEVDSLLPGEERAENTLINYYTSGMIALNKKTMEKYSISEYQIIQKILSITVDGKKFYRKIYQRKDLE